MHSKTKVDKEFEAVLADGGKVLEPKFCRDYPELTPFVREYADKWSRGETRLFPSHFYERFLKPNGVKISKRRFLEVFRDYFLSEIRLRESDQAGDA